MFHLQQQQQQNREKNKSKFIKNKTMGLEQINRTRKSLFISIFKKLKKKWFYL